MPWLITKWVGNAAIKRWEMSGQWSEAEIEVLLQRLVCSGLTADEIISASLKKRDARRTKLLDRIGRGNPIHYGENPHYTAEEMRKSSSRS